MLRLLAAALGFGLLAPSQAGAIPPPPPVAVVLVAPASLEGDSARLLESIGTRGAWFEKTDAPVGG